MPARSASEKIHSGRGKGARHRMSGIQCRESGAAKLWAVYAGGTQAADNVESDGLAKLLGKFQARRPVDHVSLRCHEAADVLIILRPPRERFHDKQILDRHHRDTRATDRERCRAANCLLLEARHPDRQIDTDAGVTVPEGQDEGTCDHLLQPGKERGKGCRVEFANEPQRIVDGGENNQIDSSGHPRLPAKRNGKPADEGRLDAAGFKHGDGVSQRRPKGWFHRSPCQIVGKPAPGEGDREATPASSCRQPDPSRLPQRVRPAR